MGHNRPHPDQRQQKHRQNHPYKNLIGRPSSGNRIVSEQHVAGSRTNHHVVPQPRNIETGGWTPIDNTDNNDDEV